MPSIQSSPLHHNVLYRSLQEDTGIHYTTEQDVLDETEEKTGLVHTSLPAQPGISRQQLINRCATITNKKMCIFKTKIF